MPSWGKSKYELHKPPQAYAKRDFQNFINLGKNYVFDEINKKKIYVLYISSNVVNFTKNSEIAIFENSRKNSELNQFPPVMTILKSWE